MSTSQNHSAKHTPGTWTANRAYFYGHDAFIVCGTVGDTSPFLCRLTDDTPDFEANARLIAAAPELLAALDRASLAIRDLSKQLADLGVEPSEGWRAFRAARAAIAKAEGREVAS